MSEWHHFKEGNGKVLLHRVPPPRTPPPLLGLASIDIILKVS